MKQLAASILILCLSAQTFHYSFVVLDFYLNQRSIASRYCVNRYRPQLHCNGQCQLAKKLRQEEKRDQQNPERSSEIKNEVLSSRSFFATLPSLPAAPAPRYFQWPPARPVDRPGDFFHPPCL
ncbi:MAG TPA: hypothetical protein VG870_10170 [Chitinophagaceae bacterium]|nr:hypothetical protein [Chitinophagaceae bacterium]